MRNRSEYPASTVEQLAEQIRTLTARVEDLSGRLAAMEQGQPPRRLVDRIGSGRPPGAEARGGPQPLVDTPVLLRRIATVCFLLVVALILRTITDNRIIDIRIGSILGMTYAALLLLLGWRLYATCNRLAPVFAGCGILLLFAIVLETHSHYASLSAGGAYLILFLAGAAVFTMSIRNQASMLICLGVPGSIAAALAIDFPYPHYPVMSFFLLAGIVAASYAFRQGTCRYLRWLILAPVVLFWVLWTMKLPLPAPGAGPSAEGMYQGWFFPLLFVFWGVYLATVVLNVLKKDMQLGIFESILPTIAAVGAFYAGSTAAPSLSAHHAWFYLATAAIATLHLGLAWWLAMVDRKTARGSNVFILAGACLIILTSATVFQQNIGYILPIWSGSALALALLSAFLHNQGVRITSYLMQTAACAAAIISGAVRVPNPVPAAALAGAAAVFLFSLIQYHWSRQHPPDGSHSVFYSRIDRKDRGRVILLISGLLGGYYFFQSLLHALLARLNIGPDHALQSGQSLIINLGALVLMALALRKRSREMMVIAALVAVIGAGKVFVFDMFGVKGTPLVLSVFSTGLVAAFGSAVMGRWHKKEEEAD
ncbi:MAG: DUF2339 domain-containing protein [Desulfobulbaceae bacterium]|nr:DUF2339 domain-containing protein [Desulfobulbaceae bacterium]MDY0349677.1 DUF2339 domain-containing protein [Desulfobulbaceae bacterium]